MNKSLFKIILFAFTCLSFASSCESEYTVIENAVYLTDAASSSSMKVTVDDTGADARLTARLVKPADNDVEVNYVVNQADLDIYNKRNGTDYRLLPEEYYEFGASGARITAGSLASAPVDIKIKPFDENLDQNYKYALPVAISDASGAEILKPSSVLNILIDQIIVTTVPYLASQNIINYECDPLMDGLSQWTLEWNLCMDAFNRNNVTQWNIFGTDDKACIYTRFGDVTCPQNQFQAKIGANKPQSTTVFTAKKWYHLALTYDGMNISFYVDGVLDFTLPHAVPGEVFTFKKLQFANANASYTFKGYANELRVWSIARTAAEISNNLYTVASDTPGLEVYWKCNEGSGLVIKDHSGHGRDGHLSKEATWKSGVRFPDDGK